MEGITASAGPTGQLTSEYRFWAFISYSQHDGRWAKWLHRRLETYRVPALLVGKDHWSGKIPARLFPVFRDRDELPSAADLGDQVHEALKRSRVLIVICSPHAARSRWVNQEIKLFKSLGREKQVFAVIVNGEPGDRRLGTACEECFPEALGHQYDCDQQPMEKKVEPIAADVREGKDGRTNAVLKLVAGILDVSYDQLKRREQERRIRWLMKFGAAMAALVVLFAGLAYYAQGQKTLARSNERLARSAENQALEAAKAERSARGMAEEQRVLADQRRAEAEAARSLAEERQRQALLRLAELYQEQGGQALLAGDQLKALVYFGESYRMGNHSAAQRLLLGESMRTLDSEKLLLRHESSVDSLSFSHNGKLLITGSADGRATIWNSLTGSVLTRLQTHVREGPKNVWQVAFKADDAGVFTATANSPPEVWDARNGQHQETLEEHSRVSLNGFGSASPFAFTLDGVLFAETTVSNEILLRNARTNHILYTLKGHTDRIGNIV